MLRAFIITVSIAVFFSCATASDKPDWIDSYPSDDQYYIGIGFSKTGIQGKDREIARKSALAELAASISTTIKGDVELYQKESSDGASVQNISRRITENIHQTLDGIDIYDSFYNEEDGYWVFIRYSKAEFQRHKMELKQRILNIISDRDARDLRTYIADTARALKLLYESPYIASIKNENNSGILFDDLEKDLYTAFSQISVSIIPDTIRTEPGRNIEVSLSVAYLGEGVPGFPLVLSAGDSNTVITTDIDGVFSGTVNLSVQHPGETILTAKADKVSLGIIDSALNAKLIIPADTCVLRVDQPKAALRVTQTGGEPVPGLDSMVKALLSESGFPLTITEESTGLLIDTEIIIEDFPRYSEDSMYITQARLIMKLKREEDVIYTHETKSVKDAGLTPGQAYERTVKKLFRELKGDRRYTEEIIQRLNVE